MNKIIIACLIAVFYSSSLFAGEISTLVLMRNDWIKSEDKESVQSQEFFAYWLYDKKIGGGIDVVTTPKANSISVKPFGTWKLSDSVHFVGGAMNTSYGSDYLHGGVWIFQNIGQWKIYLDLREYVEISGKRSDYFDAFAEIIYPVADKFSLGVVGMYDHWWQDDDHDWFFIGPIGYYHLSKSVSICCRPSLDWERNSGDTVRTVKVRVGVKLVF